jgi:uncharacterized Zn finger protein (UPF0148 family)
MLEDDKQCKNCGFDTMAIVTKKTSGWEYCPKCGSRLVTIKDDIEGNVDEENIEMKDVPINNSERNETEDSSQSENGNSQEIEINSSENQDENSEKSKTSNSVDENTDIEKELNEEDVDIEEELERLRRFTDNEDSTDKD